MTPTLTPTLLTATPPAGVDAATWWQSLLSGLIGGIVVWAASAFALWRRDRRTFRAAVLLVLDELELNIQRMLIALGDEVDFAREVSGMTDGSYRAVELVLARHLPDRVRQQVGEAYRSVRSPRWLYTVLRDPTMPHSPVVGSSAITGHYERALADLRRARGALRAFRPRGAKTTGGDE